MGLTHGLHWTLGDSLLSGPLLFIITGLNVCSVFQAPLSVGISLGLDLSEGASPGHCGILIEVTHTRCYSGCQV